MSGVFKSRSSGIVTSGVIAITRIVVTIVSVIQQPIVFDNSILCFAPKYWDTIIPTPTEIPTNNTSSRFRIGPALPTAASALSPTNLPTIILSTVLYSCCAIFPINMGIVKATIRFPGLPCVISTGANNFFMFVNINNLLSSSSVILYKSNNYSI